MDLATFPDLPIGKYGLMLTNSGTPEANMRNAHSGRVTICHTVRALNAGGTVNPLRMSCSRRVSYGTSTVSKSVS